MPAAADASAERIRDVNTRYHDLAADSYDSKWGIDFADTGRAQVTAKLKKALGSEPATFRHALEIGAGTGYFSLNLLNAGTIERVTATDIAPGMLRALEANADELGIEVRDNGRGRAASDGLGHGLVGVRERVKIYGGQMSAGTSEDGGFVLTTRLPLGGEGP